MFELFFMGGLLAFVLPLAFLGGMAYVFFWLISALLKTAGAVVGTALAIAFCVLAVVGMIVFGIFCLPFLIFT
jgi:hypothetical protein